MSKQPRRLYEFGNYYLDTRERLLMRDGEPVTLTPKVFETLVVLLERRGHLVEKEELMAALWPESYVEESNLTNNVSTLRKTLGKTSDGQRYIETISKRGYRFVASVREISDADDAQLVVERHTFQRVVTNELEETETWTAEALETSVPRRPSATAAVSPAPLPRRRVFPILLASIAAAVLLVVLPATISRLSAPRESARVAPAVAPVKRTLRSIAVLPFKTIGPSGRADTEYLGIGMSDALITRLGNNRQVLVRPTSAVRRYADPLQDPLAAGREQRVETILDGNIQRAGDRIRVTVQLFRTQDGATLWSAKFDERFTDIFALQDSISQQVMNELLVELNPEEQQRLRQRGSDNIEAYQAYLKGLYFWNKRTHDGYQKSVEYFKQAIAIDPDYAEAYVGLGNAASFLGGRDRTSEVEAFNKARAAAKKALELDETLAEAHAALGLVAMNFDWNWTESEKEFRRAIELNPNYATGHQWYGEFLACMGRFDEGIAELKLAQGVDPLSLIINTDLAKAFIFARRYDEAIAQLKRTLEMDSEFEVAHGLLALAYSAKGRHKEAVDELRKIKSAKTDPLYLSYFVYVYATAGRPEEAETALRQLKALAKQTYVSPLNMAVAYTGLGDKDQAFTWLQRVFDERASGGAISLKVAHVWDQLRSDPRYSAFQQRAGF
jgi:DNA-binding winged helix-turn-helix (wHTH) protein/TolB-like protein/Tfp pilus assembly protein PilF